MPKIHILFKLKNGPWGGANQFLKALKNKLVTLGVYEESEEKADTILFNLNPSPDFIGLIDHISDIKKRQPEKVIIARIDGPIQLYRDCDEHVDMAFFNFVKYVADGVIFQSEWSRVNCFKCGLDSSVQSATILNAPDEDIFYPLSKSQTERKIRLVSAAWSNNWKKGFDIYRYLDQNLDFNKYEMTFIGNSPCEFKNIQLLQPVPSEQLANVFRTHDVFVTASQKDPCSNSLIEAMHCGLPAIGLNDGGHPEIIKQGGLLFDSKEQLIGLLDDLNTNYEKYKQNINLPSMTEVGQHYCDFIQSVCRSIQSETCDAKKPTSKQIDCIKHLIKPLPPLKSRIKAKIKKLLKMV